MKRSATRLLSRLFALALTVLVVFTGASASADTAEYSYVPYSSYIYDYSGYWVATPHAYLPGAMLDGEALGVESLNFPSDLEYGPDGCLYLSDTGNNRILKLDGDRRLIKIIEGMETPSGITGLNGPEGLFVNEEHLFVADTGNGRVLKLTLDGECVQEIGRPETNLLSADFGYQPKALIADSIGNLFVVAKGVNMGLLRFDAAGNFVSFFAAQDATYSLIDYLWKPFMTEAQLERMTTFVPTEYNNVAMDDAGFLYVTTNDLDLETFLASISKKDGSAAPVKKINPLGGDVLVRNGYAAPVGDIQFGLDENGNEAISIIADVAVGENGMYTLLDTRENRLFTYSSNGELLYAFGGRGDQIGNTDSPVAVVYQGTDLLVLDKLGGTVTVYTQTEYGALISEALAMYGEFRYEECVEVWERILNQNANFDIAYDGIASSYLNMGDYEKAMEYFSYSNNMEAYSDAYKESRNAALRQYLVPVFLAILAALFAVIWLLRYIGKRNRDDKYKDKRHRFSGHFLYAFYVMTHPFDGFYDLKHEKRGSMLGATVWLLLGATGMVAAKVFSSYLFNTVYRQDVSIPWEYITILIPVLLWVASNWCITTLVDGEGRFRDIYLFTGYAVAPVAILFLLSVPVSYMLTRDEGMYLTLIQNIGLIWAAFLFFAGNTTIHQYSGGKSVLAIAISILGIAIMIFVALLLITSYQKMASVVMDVWREISYR